jgi:hypothetical protein
MKTKKEVFSAIMLKAASGQKLTKDEQAFLSENQNMIEDSVGGKLDKKQKKEETEAAKKEREEKIAAHKVAVNDYVKKALENVVEFENAKAAADFLKDVAKGLPEAPKGLKGSGSSNEVKPLDLDKMKADSAPAMILAVVKKAGDKGIDRKGLEKALDGKFAAATVKTQVGLCTKKLPIERRDDKKYYIVKS